MNIQRMEDLKDELSKNLINIRMAVDGIDSKKINLRKKFLSIDDLMVIY